MLFEIKHRISGAVLFKLECGSLKLCVEAAISSGAYLYGANLYGANLSGANLHGAYLSGANLSGAYLSGANLYGANLSDANLYGANLHHAYLHHANLSGANLHGANLSGANLSGANLSGANLSGAYLSGANLYGANLSDAHLYHANLSGANLSDAYLYRANLSGANLSGANLSGANLSGAYLSDAKGINPNLSDSLRILLDQPGAIRAYKLVMSNGVGPYNGGITYEVGKEYHVQNANTDANAQCGAGINLCDLPWAIKEWRPDYRILIAEFTAADIAAIPVGTDGKFRVHRCKIVGEKDLKEIGVVVGEAAMK